MKNFFIGGWLFLSIVVPALVYADVSVYFSPNGGCQEAVIKEINKAHRSIEVAMFAFTSREIAHALVEAKDRHVRIKITLDNAQIKDPYSKCRYLLSNGLNVKFHMGPGLMHDKFAVIDNQVVITGSFNWTATAEKKNAENLLIIKDKELAWRYKDQFKELWKKSGQSQIKLLAQEESN